MMLRVNRSQSPVALACVADETKPRYRCLVSSAAQATVAQEYRCAQNDPLIF